MEEDNVIEEYSNKENLDVNVMNKKPRKALQPQV